MYDPELPNGYQDADLEMAEMQRVGNVITKLERKGICVHSSRKEMTLNKGDHLEYLDHCMECGKIAPRDELDAVLQDYI